MFFLRIDAISEIGYFYPLAAVLSIALTAGEFYMTDRKEAGYSLRLPYASPFQHRILRSTFAFLEGCIANEPIKLDADFYEFDEYLPICRTANSHARRMAWVEASRDSAFLAPAVAAAYAFELDGTAGFPGPQLDWLLRHLTPAEFLALCERKGRMSGNLIVKLAAFVPDPGNIDPEYFEKTIPIILEGRRGDHPLEAEEDTDAWHPLWNIASPRGDADGLVFADMPATESGFSTACLDLIQEFVKWFMDSRLLEWQM